MKLLYCPHCQDVRKLGGFVDEDGKPATVCECGKSWGCYTDDINAVYGGDAVMLGISNFELDSAMYQQRKYGDSPSGMGRVFAAFIIPNSAPTVRKETQ